MFFEVYFDDIVTGNTLNTGETIAALIAADTAGYRCKLRKLIIGAADDAPTDLQMGFVLKRVNDVSAGSVGVPDAAPTVVPLDSLQRAAVITAGEDYVTGGTEPSVYTSPIWGADMNRRNTIIDVWGFEDAPTINRDQLLGLLAIPRTAAAAQISAYMKFQEF